MKTRHKIMLTILILALSLGLATTAWAAGTDAGGGLLRGQVTAIAGDSLTVQTPKAEVTLLTDEETVFEVPGIKDATLDDLASGDFVVVRAVRSEDGSALARHVAVIPDGSLEDEILRGIVLVAKDTTFQLRTRRGEVTIVTDSKTVFRIPNVEDATAADLKDNMPVIVMGQYDKDGQAFQASAVAIIPRRVIQRHVVRGELTAIDGSTLVVATGDDGHEEKRVQTTDETIFRVPGIEDASISDLKVGDRFVALGYKDESEELLAKSVAVVPRRPRRVVVRGEVTAVSDSSLTLETHHHGELTFTITDETQFRIPDDDNPGLDDIAVGDQVGVIGYKDQDGNLVARGVGKLPESFRGHIVRGEVTGIEGTTLQVDTADGLVMVHTGENTRFRIPGDDAPGLDDVAGGDQIGAAGRLNEDGSLQARLIGKLRQQS